jgi:hypothetical protein
VYSIPVPGSAAGQFQCAGCGYYRLDPSYLPAIEAACAVHRGGVGPTIAVLLAERSTLPDDLVADLIRPG